MAHMAESVYRNRAEKLKLISTTITDILDLNNLHVNFHGCENYIYNISAACRSCDVGIGSWSNICGYGLRACNQWDELKVLPRYDFLKLPKYAPLHLKITALRIMLNNFSDSPSADDTRYCKLENNQLIVFDPQIAGENPPSTEPDALRDNPPRHHPRHVGPGPGDNPASPRHAQLMHMLERVQHSMR